MASTEHALRRRVRLLLPYAAACCLAMLACTAGAGTMGPLVTDAPVHWHGAVIKLGDAEAQVRQATGRYPDSAQPLYIDDRYLIGERWSYLGNQQDSRELIVEFTRGRVSRVWTEPLENSEQPLSQAP